jgi:aspartate dehydrogenase
MLHLSVIGCGAVGLGVMDLLKNDPEIVFDSVIVSEANREAAQASLTAMGLAAKVTTALQNAPDVPDMLIECAGHQAIEEHVIPALTKGIPCMVVSIGALSEPGLVERLEAAARTGRTQVQLLSGAIGAIDALSAAKIGGLDSVVYTGRKPPFAWKGTPADGVFDLDALTTATMIFEGTARDAARLYPKNANVAATLSLAGLGLDHTTVKLWADPAVTENIHHVQADGAFGSFELTMRGKPLAANPKTSALTVFSVVRAIGNHAHALTI